MISTQLTIQEDPETGDAYIQLPDEIVQKFGWNEGTEVELVDNGDGTFTIQEKQYGYTYYD
jgi:hypothetical protein